MIEHRYRILWTEYGPKIEVGEVVLVGKKKIRRVKFPSGSGVNLKDTAATIGLAIGAEVRWCGRWYGREEGGSARTLIRTVTRLNRLYRKLQKHHLVD